MEEGRELVGPNTTVMSLQNGLGAEDVLCDCVGAEHVIGGKTYIGGMLLEPGRVQATIPGKDTFIGELDGSVTDRIRAIGAAFEEAGMHCIVSDNIMGVIWDKLLVNVATGAVCGIIAFALWRYVRRRKAGGLRLCRCPGGHGSSPRWLA